jgi:uncharacterized protein YqgV (UPF0045/DUF77 family)
MGLVAEFIVEPFVLGNPGPHVISALDAARAVGAALEFGPFGTLVRGDTDAVVLGAVDAAIRAAITGGASRVSVQIAAEAPATDQPRSGEGASWAR